MSQATRDRIGHVVDFIRMRENEGRAVTVGGNDDGIFQAAKVTPNIEPCVIVLDQLGETTVKDTVKIAMTQGLVRKYTLSTGGTEKWLGVVGGPLSCGEYERQTGRDNI